MALAALKGDKTLAQLAAQFQVHQSQIVAWKQQLVGRADELFARGTAAEPGADVKALHAKIGQLAMENDFLSGALHSVLPASPGERARSGADAPAR